LVGVDDVGGKDGGDEGSVEGRVVVRTGAGVPLLFFFFDGGDEVSVEG
jgi:hypothetical protein